MNKHTLKTTSVDDWVSKYFNKHDIPLPMTKEQSNLIHDCWEKAQKDLAKRINKLIPAHITNYILIDINRIIINILDNE